MKITNFRSLNYVNKGSYKEVAYADVDVTTGFWLWKKTTTCTVYKDYVYWRFIYNGKFTPGTIVEQLASSYIAISKNPNNIKG